MAQAMRNPQRLARCVVFAARMLCGWVVYLACGKTPVFAHEGMVGLFCLTGGRSNDLISTLIGYIRRPYGFTRAEGLLGDLSSEENRSAILMQLRKRGYYVRERCVPDDTCSRLLQYALTHPCRTRAMDGAGRDESFLGPYPRGTPRAVRYDFAAQDLLAHEDVQRLLADLSLLALSQDYLGARPKADVLGMWWHTDYSNIPDSEAAQYFHFDMDRPKWLKIFVYLTDVGVRNGPHSFVAGSHRAGAIPEWLLRKGYARLSDREVAETFGAADVLEFTAPRGSIIVEDTRGLHKGRHVDQGDRLVLQLQFSNCLFGATYPRTRFGIMRCEALERRIAQYPSIFTAYL